MLDSGDGGDDDGDGDREDHGACAVDAIRNQRKAAQETRRLVVIVVLSKLRGYCCVIAHSFCSLAVIILRVAANY